MVSASAERESVLSRLREIEQHSPIDKIDQWDGQPDFEIQHPRNLRQFRNSLEDDGAGGFLLGGNLVTSFNAAIGDFPMMKTASVVVEDNGQQVTRGGLNDVAVEATVLPSGQTATGQDPTSFNGLSLALRKFVTPTLKMSRALLEDSPKLAANIGAIMGGRIGRGMNRSFSTGTGGIQPAGLLPAAYSALTTASSTAFAIDELTALPSAVPQEYLEKPAAGWMMNRAIWQLIQAFKDGAGRPIWKSSVCSDWPVYFNQHFPSVITAGQPLLVFGDLSQFSISLFGPSRLQTLYEEFAEDNVVGFTAVQWADGGLLDCGDHPIVSLTIHS